MITMDDLFEEGFEKKLEALKFCDFVRFFDRGYKNDYTAGEGLWRWILYHIGSYGVDEYYGDKGSDWRPKDPQEDLELTKELFRYVVNKLISDGNTGISGVSVEIIPWYDGIGISLGV